MSCSDERISKFLRPSTVTQVTDMLCGMMSKHTLARPHHCRVHTSRNKFVLPGTNTSPTSMWAVTVNFCQLQSWCMVSVDKAALHLGICLSIVLQLIVLLMQACGGLSRQSAVLVCCWLLLPLYSPARQSAALLWQSHHNGEQLRSCLDRLWKCVCFSGRE